MKMWAAVVATVGMLVGCAADATPLEGAARDAAVIERIVRDTAEQMPVDPERPDANPVVFAVGVEGTLPIEVQAAVAAALVDEVDVRFVDERAESIDDTTEDRRVRDAGVLVVIGPIAATGRAIDVEVERYVAVADGERFIVRMVLRGQDWTSSSTSTLPVLVG